LDLTFGKEAAAIMLELQQQDIPKLKSERTVSNNSVPEDGGNNGNSYDLVFPALPDSKTLGPKSIGINGQCGTVSAPPKTWSKVRTLTVNQVIYYTYLPYLLYLLYIIYRKVIVYYCTSF
jgi:hypothetical protein